MVKKLKSQATDEYLFRQEVGDVVPLKTPPRSNSKAPRTQYRKPRNEAVAASIAPTYLPLTQDQPHIDAEDGSSHRKNGVQKRVIQRLKRGRFPTGGQLDLHHMNVASGHTALLEFIADARDRKVACVRIIHGKGLRSKDGPRLKLMTRQTLREHPGVLAFNTCKPADGGSGAVDVLLKAP